MTKAPAKRRKGDGRVAFLAKKDLINELLQAGYAQRTVYEEHKAELDISYSQFNRYVAKYLKQKAPKDEHQNEGGYARSGHERTTSGGHVSGTAASTRPGDQESKPKKTTGGFHHNPRDGNERDDLI